MGTSLDLVVCRVLRVNGLEVPDAGIALALGAIVLATRPASDARTFGWYRAEIRTAVLARLMQKRATRG